MKTKGDRSRDLLLAEYLIEVEEVQIAVDILQVQFQVMIGEIYRLVYEELISFVT